MGMRTTHLALLGIAAMATCGAGIRLEPVEAETVTTTVTPPAPTLTPSDVGRLLAAEQKRERKRARARP